MQRSFPKFLTASCLYKVSTEENLMELSEKFRQVCILMVWQWELGDEFSKLEKKQIISECMLWMMEYIKVKQCSQESPCKMMDRHRNFEVKVAFMEMALLRLVWTK